MLGGRIDFFRGQQHHCAYGGAARFAHGKGERGGTLVVRKVGDGEGVMIAERSEQLPDPARRRNQ